jgi:hypothetical protein
MMHVARHLHDFPKSVYDFGFHELVLKSGDVLPSLTISTSCHRHNLLHCKQHELMKTVFLLTTDPTVHMVNLVMRRAMIHVEAVVDDHNGGGGYMEMTVTPVLNLNTSSSLEEEAATEAEDRVESFTIVEKKRILLSFLAQLCRKDVLLYKDVKLFLLHPGKLHVIPYQKPLREVFESFKTIGLPETMEIGFEALRVKGI